MQKFRFAPPHFCIPDQLSILNFLIITELGEAGNMTTDSGDETDSTGRYDSGSPKGVSDPESPIPYPGRQPVIRHRGKPI
ncbi:Uncharacterized protein dnm_052990 [Desulfonema magnum]|uniref:Uncharacterized protein n=1 Tax=Desulfonema magnum TaxID=45655 RepID=A0A975GPW5_9BACT|nr:Uncharacterized protein dnm_052990 [Desulfonema magnum]